MKNDSATSRDPVRFSVEVANDGPDGVVCGGVLLSGVWPGTDAPAMTLVVAESGEPVTVMRSEVSAEGLQLELAERVELRPGDLLCSPDARPEVSDQFAAMLTWSSPEPLLPGRRHTLALHSRFVSATVTEIKYRLDPTTGDRLAAKTLGNGETAFCNFSLSELVAFDPRDQVEATSRFTLLGADGAPVGSGQIEFGLRRATNVHRQALDVNKQDRALLKRQRPCVLWFTGLSGSGKSTVANVVERALHGEGRHTYLLDGDNVRHGLNRDLGFSDADRVENIRRVAEVAKLFVDAGTIVIVAFISPFRAERKLARDLVANGEFLEVFVDTPIEECRRRDPKGLYARADRGEIKNFTGVDSPYEPPADPEIHLRTVGRAVPELAQQVLQELRQRGLIGASVRPRSIAAS